MSSSSAAIPQGIPDGGAVIDATIIATLGIVASLCLHVIFVFLPERIAGAEGAVLWVLGALIAGAYFIYAWGHEVATLGQRMLGLRVVRVDAPVPQAIGAPRAFRRVAGLVVGVFVLDGLVALIRSDRRALHDVIADTIVVPQAGPVASPGVDRPLRTVCKGRKYA